MDELIGITEEEAAILDAALIEAHENQDTQAEAEEDINNLPLNSPSLLVNDTTSRFSSAEWFNKIQEQVVTLGGLGGIGSYVAFLLGRLKVKNLFMYDFDSVEEANLSGQLYSTDNIGQHKTTAIAFMLLKYCQYYNALEKNNAFVLESPTTDIMIGGFDSMESRYNFYHAWKKRVQAKKTKEDKEKCLLIDARLAAEEFQVFCIKGTDDYLMKKYEEDWLFSDDQAEATVCSYKQTSFCANMIGSVVVNLFVNFVANQLNPLMERALPFITKYDAKRMFFKIEDV